MRITVAKSNKFEICIIFTNATKSSTKNKIKYNNTTRTDVLLEMCYWRCATGDALLEMCYWRCVQQEIGFIKSVSNYLLKATSYNTKCNKIQVLKPSSVKLQSPCLLQPLRYKSEGRGFDSRWCHWNFSLT